MVLPVTSLLEPPPESALTAALNWIEGALTGTLATIVATIAVAGLGLLLLSGRIDARRGLAVLLGCFVLFGASSIAQGLRQAAEGGDGAAQEPAYIQPIPPIPALPLQVPNPGYDPYAGASVPQ